MQKFLLLRNNKQTGPYSVEELEQMGLKPYDLIWINGKSAAWRYPGEIDELKSFAPAVEEQPYDRFYKRPSDDSQKKNDVVKTEAVKQAPTSVLNGNGTPIGNGNGNGNGNGSSNNNITYSPAPNSPSKKTKEYKRVFVTMPNAASLKKTETPVQQIPVEEIPQKIVEPIPAVPEKQKPVKVETFHDDDRRHASMDIYYTKKKGVYLRKSFLIGAFAIGILSLIALGMFIGLSLQQPPKEAGKQETERVYRVSDNDSKLPPADTHQNVADNPNHNAQAFVPAPDSSVKLNAEKKIKTQRNTVRVQLKDLQQKAGVKTIDSTLNITPIKPEPEKRVAEKRMPDLSKFVTVSNNDFQVGPFGGISHLEMTVHNSSTYDIDLVVVDLEYLKVNKEVFKTETLYFKDVNANSSVTVAAPKSSRGNKINYKISLISSKDRLYHASSD